MIKRIPITPIFFAVVLFALAALLNRSIEKPPIVINKQDSAFNLQNSFYRFTFAGYKRLVADVLWITTLLESDTTHYKNDDLNNWMFLRFNSITTLDPKFLAAYTFGAQYLSIVKDDPKGASIIFEKGLKQYPKNYSLNFNAGFLYAFELDNPGRGVELYRNIKEHPSAPKFINSLIAKLEYENSGDLETTFQILLEMFKNEKRDELLREKLQKDLYAVKAMIDLECLNSNGSNCSYRDYNGVPYIKENGNYLTQQPFTPYQLHKKKGAQ